MSSTTSWHRNRQTGRLIRSTSPDLNPRPRRQLFRNNRRRRNNENNDTNEPAAPRRSRRIAQRRNRNVEPSRSRSRSRSRSNNTNQRNRQNRRRSVIVLSDDDDDDNNANESPPQRRRSRRIQNRQRRLQELNEIDQRIEAQMEEIDQQIQDLTEEFSLDSIPSHAPVLRRQNAFQNIFSSESESFVERLGRNYRLNRNRNGNDDHIVLSDDDESEGVNDGSDIEIIENEQDDELDEIVFIDDDGNEEEEDEEGGNGGNGSENGLNLESFLQLIRQRYAGIDPLERERIINALPTRILTEFDAPTKSCMICLRKYKAGDKLRTLLCFHQYHSECIDQWFQTKLACPICRFSIRSDQNDSLIIDE